MSGNSLLLQGQQSAKAASGGLETKAANGSDALTNNAQKTQNGPYDEDGDLSAHLVKWGGHIASKNRNPGNLRYAGIGWDGEIGEEAGFSKFNSVVYGTRAMMKNMNTIIKRGGNSIHDLINTWAPACENDTVSYINMVSKGQKINANDRVLTEIKNMKDYCIGIAKCIAKVEDQIEFKDATLETAYNLATGGGGSNAAIQTGGNQSAVVNTPPSSSGVAATSPANENAGAAKVDIDKALKYNKSYGYSRETWKEIQRGIGMSSDQIDGIVGRITTQAIADWQARNGFTGSDLDGICGPNTLKAIRKAAGQAPVVPDTTPKPETNVEVKPETPVTPDDAQPTPVTEEIPAGNITAHFSWSEFACHNGEQVPKDLRPNTEKLCKNLEIIRSELGDKSITINSGYRAPSYNANVPGAAKNSQHMYGNAADIVVSGYTPGQVHAKIEELIAAGKIQDGGLGKYHSFTHYDVRDYHARWNGP